MSYLFQERDWKLFRKKLPDWQEAYMDRLNHEYLKILNEKGNPSDRFRDLEKRIREDKKEAGVVIHDMSRSHMLINIIELYNCGAITLADLDGFSEELQEHMKLVSDL